MRTPLLSECSHAYHTHVMRPNKLPAAPSNAAYANASRLSECSPNNFFLSDQKSLNSPLANASDHDIIRIGRIVPTAIIGLAPGHIEASIF